MSNHQGVRSQCLITELNRDECAKIEFTVIKPFSQDSEWSLLVSWETEVESPASSTLCRLLCPWEAPCSVSHIYLSIMLDFLVESPWIYLFYKLKCQPWDWQHSCALLCAILLERRGLFFPKGKNYDFKRFCFSIPHYSVLIITARHLQYSASRHRSEDRAQG